MRALQALAGILIIIVGSVAVIAGEFDTAAGWVLALGLSSLGLAGLISAIASSQSVDSSG